MKKILFSLLMLLAIKTQSQNSWTQKADFGGTARYGAVAFNVGDKGYLGTGNDGTGNKKDFWEYDPATDAWTQKADFGGTPRFYAIGFSIGAKGYIGTGHDGSFQNDFWEYDPLLNSWTQKANFGGTGRYLATGFSIQDKGYVGTGYDGAGKSKDFWEYNPATNSWTRKADFGGTSRYIACGFGIGNKGYLGTGADGSILKKDFWEFDPANNSWVQKADFGGTSRYYATGFTIGGKGYMGTGYDGTHKSDFWEYTPATNSWIQKANFGGSARSHGKSFSIGSKGYLGTGNGGISSVNFRDFWEYTPEIVTYTITSSASANGTISPAGSFNVTINANQTYTITPNPGYQATDVLVDGLSVGAVSTYTFNNVTAPHTISASFSLIPALAGALHFDGVDDYVEVPHNSMLNSLPLTVECWVKTSSTAGITGFVNKYVSGSGNGYRLGANNGYAEVYFFGPDGLGAYSGAAIYDKFIPQLFIADNQWHHVAMVVDNSGTKLIIDGTLRAVGCWSGTPVTPTTSTPLRIGSYPAPGSFVNGSIDEVRIWNRALCEQELNNNKDCELAPTQTGLLAYYKFNQGSINVSNSSVNTLNDAGSNNFNGTLNNFSLSGTSSNWVNGAISSACSAFAGNCINTPVSCPSFIFNPDLWLKADAGVITSGSNVTSWQDQSGNNRHATATASNVQLIPGAYNGKPALHFSAPGGFVTPVFQTFPGKRGTVIVVSKTTAPGTVAGGGFGTLLVANSANPRWQFGATPAFFGFWDGTGCCVANVGANSTDPGITTLIRNSNTNIQFARNGSTPFNLTIADNQPAANTLNIGTNGGAENLVGDIAEIIVYGRTLSAAELESVSNYLSSKYNIPLTPATQPAITLSKSTLNFGNLGLGFSLKDSVVITNTGTAPLNISGINSDDANYSVLYYKNTLAPHDTTHLILRYTPSVSGTSSGNISIAHNAVGSPSVISVQGNASATGFTYQLHQIPGLSGALYGASWFNGRIGYVNGANGRLYKTTDGGGTWVQLPFNGPVTLYSIRCIGSELWLFGDNGHICVSHDGGQTFVPFTTGTSNTFYSGYFVNGYYGFAVGSNGTLCRYNGTAWEPYNLGLPNNFYGVYAYGNYAWAVGSGGIVCRYNRVCNCWQPINPGVPNNIYGVGFWNESIGYIVGSGGLIYRTVNGGTSWMPCNSGVSVDIRKIKCYNANIAWAVCGDGRILQTSDGGNTWVQLPLGNFNFEDVDFNGCQGIAICHNGAVVTFQIDVCNTSYNPYYTRISTGAPYHYRSAWIANRNICAVGGRYGSVSFTGNGGQSWYSTNPYTIEDIHCVRVFGNTSFIAGSGGYIAKCNNLGTNWVRFGGIPTGITFYSMAFYPNGTGWAVGSGGTICYYNGTNWVPYNTGGISNTFRCVYVIGDVAYAVGTGGIICKYINGAWTDVSPGVTNDFYGCAFVTPLIGYAVGSGGIICKTINGGQSWFPITTCPTNEDLHCVEVGCKLEAMVAGKNGAAYQTSNGGNSWNDKSLQRPVHINSISLLDGDGLMAADDGELYAFKFGAGKVTANIVANGPSTFCEGGSVTLTASGGTSYEWSTGATADAIAVNQSGKYKVVVGNAAGCTDEKEQEVIVNPKPTLAFELLAEICQNGSSITLSATPAGGVFSGKGVTGNSFNPTAAGAGIQTIKYTYTTPEGCSNTIERSILVNTYPVILVTANKSLVYYGYSPQSCAQLSIGAIGGTPGYSYSWSNGAASNITTVCPSATTTYQATATDIKGCSNTGSVTIAVVDVRCGTDKNPKVKVCHTVPQKQNVQLCVDENAVPAMLANGDYLGECITGVQRTSPAFVSANGPIEVIKVFPNPTTSAFNIQLAKANHTMQGTVRLYNMQGQVVEERAIGNTVVQMGGKLTPGLYIMQVIADGKQYQWKLVKQ